MLVVTAVAVVLAVKVVSWAADKTFPDYCYTQTHGGRTPGYTKVRHVCDGRPGEVPESVVR